MDPCIDERGGGTGKGEHQYWSVQATRRRVEGGAISQ